MSVVTNFPAMPNRIAIACEYLQYVGVAGVSSENFERALSPLREREEGGKVMATAVLKEVEDLGLAITGKDGIVRLYDVLGESPQSGRDASAWYRDLRPYLTQILLSADRAAQHRQRHVPEAIAWLLCQESARPLFRSGDHAERLGKQFAVDSFDVNLDNDSRFQNLIYWSSYLGLCESFASLDRTERCVPDPTRALRRILPHVFEHSSRLGVDAFVETVAERLPVLENGDVRYDVECRLLPEYQRPERHFSQSTSLALRRLEIGGEIRLVALSDAPAWLRVNGDNAFPVSHIELLEAVA